MNDSHQDEATEPSAQMRDMEMSIVAFHGTDRMDFARFDIEASQPFNMGLHFGTKATAESRIDFLREVKPANDFCILTCELALHNPLRVDDVFGHSYTGLFDIFEYETVHAPRSACVFDNKHVAVVGEEAVAAAAKKPDSSVLIDAFGVDLEPDGDDRPQPKKPKTSDPGPRPPDWPEFRGNATALLEHCGWTYYIKEDLLKAI